MLPNDVKVGYDASELRKVLDEFANRGANIGEYTPVIAEEIVSDMVERFELQSGFEQGPWQPLEPETIKARKVSQDPQALRDSGILFGSLTPYSDAETAEGYTNVPYAKYHTSPEPREVIPLRDFTDIDFGSLEQRAIDLVLGDFS